MNSTKEGIRVRVGQLWRDLDKRMTGRVVRVYAVGNGFAMVRAYDSLTHKTYGRSTRLSLARMHDHSTGFSLESGADSVVDGSKREHASE